MQLNLSRARKPPYDHQRVGIEALVKLDDPSSGRIYPGCFFLADEMGAGKTKQVIDAAQVLFELGEIDRVIVVAPAPVRDVWFDPDFGELKKHRWFDLPTYALEYHRRLREWAEDCRSNGQLSWVITNYDYVRSTERLDELLPMCGPKTWLVLDESSAVKSHKAQQTKACLVLRRACGRITLLNGTPIAHSPLDMYAQGLLLDPRILGCKSFFVFRAKYALLGGFQGRQVVGWQNLEDMQTRFKPYILRRLKKDCLDLPPKMEPITLSVPLTAQTWEAYKDMRDELITWFDKQTVSVAAHAATRVLRLAQITSGFVGGIQTVEGEDDETEELIDDRSVQAAANILAGVQDFALDHRIAGFQVGSKTLKFEGEIGVVATSKGRAFIDGDKTVFEVGSEKLDLLVGWVGERLKDDPNLKLLVWCRFRPELARTIKALREKFTHVQTGAIWGGQKKDERTESLRLLKPGFAPDGPVIVVGTPATGSMGLDLAASHDVVYLSNDTKLKTRLQSEDRVHRPGQTFPVSYFDVIATGPKGQRTIDHAVLKALHEREQLATWTCSAWIRALQEE